MAGLSRERLRRAIADGTLAATRREDDCHVTTTDLETIDRTPLSILPRSEVHNGVITPG